LRIKTDLTKILNPITKPKPKTQHSFRLHEDLIHQSFPSSTPTPCIKGDMVVVQVEEEDYLDALEDCKTHLHGWIILSKRDKPLTHLDLTKKLQLVWKVIRP